MREMSVGEAAEDFAHLITLVERGETVIIHKDRRCVAKVQPMAADLRDDPEWRTAHERLMADLRGRAGDGYRVGRVTEEDKHGPLPGGG
jgi:antitoxin (DNA-binding transcriptional repressor) of toxin-antitoxin stability system